MTAHIRNNLIQFEDYRRSKATDRILRALRRLETAQLGLEEATIRAVARANLLEKLSENMAADFARVGRDYNVVTLERKQR